MRTLKCDNCASSDFEKISDQEYRCRYCGSIKIAQYGVFSTKSNQPAGHSFQKKHIIALAVIFALMSVTLLIITRRDKTSPSSSRIECDTLKKRIYP
jgi:uncharacterized membrane protein YvbJ